MLVDAYVTEKIFDAIHCDCIPLYAGGGNYLEPEIINPKAIIRWDADKKFGCDPTILERAHSDSIQIILLHGRLMMIAILIL